MPITLAALSPDGRFLLTGGSWDPQKSAGIWDMETGKVVHRLSGHYLPVRSVAFSPDGRLVLTARGNVAGLWDTATGRQVRQFRGHRYAIASLAFSPDGRYVLTGSEGPVVLGQQGASVRLWETDTARELHQFPLPIGISSVAYSPDGRYVAAGSTGHPVHGWKSHVLVWDAATGKETRRFPLAELITSLAFSPDARFVAAGSGDNRVRLWELATGAEALQLQGHSSDVTAIAFSPDRRVLLTASKDGTTRLWNADDGEPLCRFVSFGDGSWVVVTADGRFDASDPDDIPGLHWLMPDEPLRPLRIEIFMRDYYEPRLLARVLSGEKLPAVRDLSELNRVQPKVNITKVEPQLGTDDLVNVTVSVSSVARNYGGRERESGLRDLHLFRDGQWVGDHSLAGDKGQATKTFASIKLPRTRAGKVEFTAYAFNEDRVKSETTRPFVHRFDIPSRKGRVYVISIGVDEFDPHQPFTFGNLRYAVKDAMRFAELLSEAFCGSEQFDELVPITLISAHEAHEDTSRIISTASKQHIKAVFDLLAGRTVNERAKQGIPAADRIEPARPEDMILISFSAHGYTRGREPSEARLGGREGEFYLVPADIDDHQGGQVLDRCISAEQLSLWLRDVDAGEMVMIIDACQSAGSTGQGFKPGPMGNRGLGQLAYNKRMRILAASQITQPAKEVGGLIGHGLLSYALLSMRMAAEWDIGGEVLGESAGEVQFTGNCVSQGMAAAEVRHQASSTSIAPMVASPRPIEPSQEVDGWLEYRDLLPSGPFDPGRLLYRNGRPLPATVLAAYAADVLWYHHSQPTEAIRRPLGLLQDVGHGVRFTFGGGSVTLGREPFRFLSAPKGAICFFQYGSQPLAHVLASSSRCSPDIFQVRPDQAVGVSVNDSRFPSSPHRGSFNLWVKLIS